MIEMIRQTEDTIKLPKNIRQIGNPASNWKIYVEDYVYTYLHPAAEQERAEKKVCVLFGKVHRAEKNYIFISGAVAVEPILKTVGLPEFTEEAWEYVYQQAKEYFSDFEIVGWSVMTSFWPLHLLPEFENLHRRYFEGADKVMFLMDPEEQEEHFYRLAEEIFRASRVTTYIMRKMRQCRILWCVSIRKSRGRSSGYRKRKRRLRVTARVCRKSKGR